MGNGMEHGAMEIPQNGMETGAMEIHQNGMENGAMEIPQNGMENGAMEYFMVDGNDDNLNPEQDDLDDWYQVPDLGDSSKFPDEGNDDDSD
eukprot:6999508-Karenia_brevis.AAC.1